MIFTHTNLLGLHRTVWKITSSEGVVLRAEMVCCWQRWEENGQTGLSWQEACGNSITLCPCGEQKSSSEHSTPQTMKRMGYDRRRPHWVPLLSTKNWNLRLTNTGPMKIGKRRGDVDCLVIRSWYWKLITSTNMYFIKSVWVAAASDHFWNDPLHEMLLFESWLGFYLQSIRFSLSLRPLLSILHSRNGFYLFSLCKAADMSSPGSNTKLTAPPPWKMYPLVSSCQPFPTYSILLWFIHLFMYEIRARKKGFIHDLRSACFGTYNVKYLRISNCQCRISLY